MEGDQEDEVVAEYDVYVSQLLGQLHIFQYPLRSYKRPYEFAGVTLNVSVGTGESSSENEVVAPLSRLYMTGVLDVSGKKQNFDSERLQRMQSGDGIKKEVDDAMYGEESADPGGVHLLRLQSHPARLNANYMVGFFVDNEVHVTPVKSIQQFTPELTSWHDESSRNPDMFMSRIVAEGNSVNAPQTQQLLERKLRGLRSVYLRNERENTTAVEFFTKETLESISMRRRLLCPTTTSSNKGTVAADSLSFFPLDETQDVSLRMDRQLIARYAGKYSLQQQVKEFVIGCKICTLGMLMSSLQPSADAPVITPDVVLPVLRRFAVLAHGVWILCYDSEFRDQAATLREYIILKFAQSPTASVQRREIQKEIPADPPLQLATQLILKSLATLREDPKRCMEDEPWFSKRQRSDSEGELKRTPLREWKLKYTDTEDALSFSSYHPQEAHHHSTVWARREHDIHLNFSAVQERKTVPMRNLRLIAPTSTSGTPPVAAAASSPGATRVSQGLDPAVRQRYISTFKWLIRQLFLLHGVFNKQRLKEIILEEMRKPRSIVFQYPKECAEAAMKEELMAFTEATWILKTVDPETDKYRKYVVMAVQRLRGFTSKDALEKALELMRREAEVTASSIDNASMSIPQQTFLNILGELAEFKQGEKLWHLKTGLVDVAAYMKT